MKPLTKQWLHKADEDYRVMRRELRASDENPGETTFDAICFHAQQCAEKMVKGFLEEHNIPFPKTHDIRDLILLARPIRQEWDHLISDAAFLTRFASNFRYPGESAFREEVDAATAACERIRKIVLQAFKDLDQLRLQ